MQAAHILLLQSLSFSGLETGEAWSSQANVPGLELLAIRQERHVASRRPNHFGSLLAVALDENDGLDIVKQHSPASSEPEPATPSQPQQNQLQQQQVLRLFNWSAGDDLDREKLLSRTINALFLAASFGYAIYTILHINEGMTRGWTQTEIAMRIPLDTWSSYESALDNSPVATKTMINVVIYLLGDWLSQTVFSKHHVLDFDLGRTLRNGLIGLGFGPLVHEYYQFSDAVLPVEGGLENRILKIFMDQTLYLSVKCSMYIFAVNALQGESMETSAGAVKEKLGGVVITAWKFWPLVHCLTYSIIPARHRILWVNCVDLVWNAILASLSQEQPTAPPDEVEDEATQKEGVDVTAPLASVSSSSSQQSATDAVVASVQQPSTMPEALIATLRADPPNAVESKEEEAFPTLCTEITDEKPQEDGQSTQRFSPEPTNATAPTC